MGLAKEAVQSFAETFVVNQSLVLCINPPAGGWSSSPHSPSAKPLGIIVKRHDKICNT